MPLWCAGHASIVCVSAVQDYTTFFVGGQSSIMIRALAHRVGSIRELLAMTPAEIQQAQVRIASKRPNQSGSWLNFIPVTYQEKR
eukprot:6256513-Amphidinium_carterae.1